MHSCPNADTKVRVGVFVAHALLLAVSTLVSKADVLRSGLSRRPGTDPPAEVLDAAD
jgi:hypothetical protein